MELIDTIRNISDFPKKGIVFRDITTLLKNPEAFSEAVNQLYDYYKFKKIDKVVGIESRGFIVGAVLAYKLGVGFVPIRKKNKLPAETVSEKYQLEYGTDIIEIHKDAIQKNERIILHDDLLATGGTIAAATKLVEKLGGKIEGISFLIELNFLDGRKKLEKYDVKSLIQYNVE